MRPALRSVLAFLAMVAAGLAVVLLFQDVAPAPPSAVYGKGGRVDDALGVVDESGETRVSMAKALFDVHGDVEVEPGRFEKRPVYRVSLRNVRPGGDGEYLVDEPHITFLDGLTGAVRGELTAARGRLLSAEQVGGKLRFDPAQGMEPDELSLQGDVRGTMPFDDGPPATLEAAEVVLREDVVSAPGAVTWRRGELTLTGLDMRWDEPAGLLTYARDAVLSVSPTGGRPGAVVHGPGGLRWHRGDGDGGGWGELLGPVTGSADDGSRLSADVLRVAPDADALTLEGEAWIEVPRGERRWRLAAPLVVAARAAAGGLELARASGGVRVDDLSRPADAPTWLQADELFAESGVLVAPGVVSAASAGFLLGGVDLRWDEPAGLLTLEREVVVQGGAGVAEVFRGARLDAAGGLQWHVGDGDGLYGGRGVLQGGVGGSLADGSTFRAESLRWDGAAGTLLLEGDVGVLRVGPPRRESLAARRVELHLDPEAGLTAANATGDVRLERHDAEQAEPLVVASERLDVLEDLLTTPELVQVRRGALEVTGRGLRYDDRTGVLDLQHDVTLAMQQPAEGGELRLQAVALRWVLPAHREGGLLAGRGELVGPVNGTAPGGRSLRAGRAELDGPARRVTLLGDARVRGDDGALLHSEQLEVAARPEGLLVTSPLEVAWEQASGSGRGTVLLWDEAEGLLRLERDVLLSLSDDAGPEALQVRGDGPLVWRAPPGAADALAEGRGELAGNVHGEGRDGLHFRTGRLVVDGPARTASFVGPSQVSRSVDGARAEISAQERIDAVRDADGRLQRLEALGDVVGTLASDPPLAVQAARLVTDVAAGVTTLHGQIVASRGELRLRTGTAGRVEVTTDAGREVRRVEAIGRVTIEAGELSGTGDRLTWDVAGDHVRLEGDVRLLAVGIWQIVPFVELWPEAMRWATPPSTTVIEEEP